MKKVVLLFLTVFLSCFKTDEYLKIGTNVWPGYEPLYVARELGYLKDIPVHIVEYSSASQVMRAYRNNVINSAALTLDEVILLRSYGFRPVVVLVMDFSNGADVIIARRGIETLSDLKGKKIGVENSALGAYMLTRALEKAGLTVNDVKIVPLEVDEHLNWFKRGKIDAVVTFEPVKSKILKAGGRVIFDSSQIPEEIVDVLVVEKEYLDKNPSVVKKLVNQWFRAVNFLKENPKEAFRIISQREHITDEELNKAYAGIKIPGRKENRLLLDSSKPKLEAVARKLLKIMKEKRIISQNSIDIDGIFDGRFIEED
ncbi:ABC transporter substrate-binding protein [Persephonella atlantica]|uniref:ABC transporter substrate-binding protein n=1 Tax=Persephonella atlantica TaxID=2699429 RepID=A0ABS1GH75_9AQUI|nr:ABC transporter substrate-binding protein [Persephonella atlantica]MBK3332248.1 ABC transporter substrate-binding protein [Persephonella atlantica]